MEIFKKNISRLFKVIWDVKSSIDPDEDWGYIRACNKAIN